MSASIALANIADGPGPYADSVVSSSQGFKKDGSLVDADRSDPENALGPEDSQTSGPFNFFSLGFDGNIVLKFENYICNDDSFDVYAYETTWGNPSTYPLEKALVSVSRYGIEWVDLGYVDNHGNTEVSMPTEMYWAQYVKILDATDPAPHADNADAYDLDAVKALNSYATRAECFTNQSPTADPNGPYLGAVDTSISFDGTGSSDPDGDPLIYDWEFGDGSPSASGATPSHTYDEAAIYDVCLTVDDGFGGSDQACTIAVVYDPSAGFVTGGGWIDSPPGAYMPDPSGANIVTEANVGVDWFSPDLREDGYVAFVEGPSIPPIGIGSLEMGSSSGSDKAQLFNYGYISVALSDIEAITYSTYRNGSSTNPPAQYPALNMEVDNVGDGTGYTTLVWEPIYAYGLSNLVVDTWQSWDTMALSQTGFGGGWWSTKDIPGVCRFDCFVDWDTIVSNNPDAKIKYGFGVNIGSGWNGEFTGNVDALSITISGETTTYDFEPYAPFDPIGKANFGFVSKYKKGADVPTGSTEFQFHAGDLNFHSSSYDWLVVTGSDYAKFKGIGTINGEGVYKFQIWAGDNEPDTFRIKIWYEEDGSEIVVYDNGMDQEIGGGSIVIHTKK